MGQEDRKPFEEWQTHIAYMRQQGRCKNCGGSLDYGMGTGKKFEKHHSDGDHSNNATDNLDLLCKQCHMATLAEADPDYKKNYTAFLEKKKEIFDQLTTLTEKAIGKELAGTVISSSIELLGMSEKSIMEQYGMNGGVFYAPPSIRNLVAVKRMYKEVDAMKEGIQIGINLAKELVKNNS